MCWVLPAYSGWIEWIYIGLGLLYKFLYFIFKMNSRHYRMLNFHYLQLIFRPYMHCGQFVVLHQYISNPHDKIESTTVK